MQEFLARYMPENASAHGPHLDFINALVHWLMFVLFVGWSLYFMWVLFRYRARKNPTADYVGARSHFSTWTEGAVVIAEVILLVAFSIPAWSRWVTPPPRSENPMVIRVVSEQFAWNVHYSGPDGTFGRTDVKLIAAGTNPLGLDESDPSSRDDVVSINQLHLPVDRAVTILLSSKDVIHSFGLPPMRVKQDAIPGMEISVHFTPVKRSGTKRWEIACAQLCGLGHYRMRGQLVVETQAEFDAWLQANTVSAEAAQVAGN